MKLSIRSKFSVGMFFLIIILVLSIFSAYYMNKLSKDSGNILKENYLSVVYAREMAGGLTNINQEIINCYLTNKTPDSLLIKKGRDIIDKSLLSEKNNITEPGEAELVSGIETGIKEYHDHVAKFIESPKSESNVLLLQKKIDTLYRQLAVLSQMNGKAIEVKTDNNRISSQDALTQMSIIATLCFIIALFYSYSFSSYSNDRFFQLYNGIKEIQRSNYGNKLYIDGTDEIYEISLVFNEMADKINENQQRIPLSLMTDVEKDYYIKDLDELKGLLIRIKNIEEQAETLMARLKDKNNHIDT